MAVYRTINMTFWTDSKVVDDFTPEDKYFYLYLMTNPHTNLCGCYEISLSQMAMETGYNKDTIERLLTRFAEVHNVIRFSKTTKEVWILNWNRYNWTRSEKFLKPLQTEIYNIKSATFRAQIQELYDTVSIRYPYRMDTTDTDTDIDTLNNNIKSNSEDSKDIKDIENINYKNTFEEFWKNYPRKDDKGGAYAKYMARINSGYKPEELLEACKNYAEECKAENRDKKYIKMGRTFLSDATPFVDYLRKGGTDGSSESNGKGYDFESITGHKISEIKYDESKPLF